MSSYELVWACGSCHLLNKKTSQSCERCSTPRPEHAPKSNEVKAEAQRAGTEKATADENAGLWVVGILVLVGIVACIAVSIGASAGASLSTAPDRAAEVVKFFSAEPFHQSSAPAILIQRDYTAFTESIVGVYFGTVDAIGMCQVIARQGNRVEPNRFRCEQVPIEISKGDLERYRRLYSEK